MVSREVLTPVVVAALASLGRGDAEGLSGAEHCSLLLFLAEDLMEMERMRTWLQRRLVSEGPRKRHGVQRGSATVCVAFCAGGQQGWGSGAGQRGPSGVPASGVLGAYRPAA